MIKKQSVCKLKKKIHKKNNITSLSRHSQLCLMRLRFKRYFSHHNETQMIMSRKFKENIGNWLETIEIRTWMKSNCAMRLVNAIKPSGFKDAELKNLRNFH